MDGVRDDVRQIHDLISEAFARRGEQMPRMLAVATCETDADEHIYESFFELAPGVALSIAYGSPDDFDGEEFPKWEAQSAAEEAATAIRSYLELGIDRLSALLHDLRLRGRRIIAGTTDDCGTGRLVDLRLTASGWHVAGRCHVRLRLEGLDAHLKPAIGEIQVNDLDTFEADLQRWGRTMADRHAARRALALQGASGSIDLLTLNAISTFADPQAWIRSLARTVPPDSPDLITIFAEAEAYRSHGKDGSSALSWNRDKVHYPMSLPATLLVAYTGRPITDLIEHPMLSEDMIVRDAASTIVGKDAVLTVEIEQPRLLFCVDSGRTWRNPDAVPEERAR